MGWKRWFLSLFSFGSGPSWADSLVSALIQTRYSKQQGAILLMTFTTSLLRWHLQFLLGGWVPLPSGVHFVFMVGISVLLTLYSGWIYAWVTRFKKDFYYLSSYLILHTNAENYRRWKRWAVLVGGLYALVILTLFPIDHRTMMCSIVQFLLSYLLVDAIEHRSWKRIPRGRLFFRTQRPRVIPPREKLLLFEDYKEEEVFPEEHLPRIEEKIEIIENYPYPS